MCKELHSYDPSYDSYTHSNASDNSISAAHSGPVQVVDREETAERLSGQPCW